jgi:hypothetical protein
MKAAPLFLAACALASIGGIVSGATIDTEMIQHAGIGMNDIHRPEIAFDPADTGLSDQVALPDHYALNTPSGRFEVAELSNRGLYAQRRFGWREAQYAPPPEAPLPEPVAEPGWSYEPPDAPLEISAEAPRQVIGGPPQAEVQASVQQAAPDGEARIIDVQAELAGA